MLEEKFSYDFQKKYKLLVVWGFIIIMDSDSAWR